MESKPNMSGRPSDHIAEIVSEMDDVLRIMGDSNIGCAPVNIRTWRDRLAALAPVTAVLTLETAPMGTLAPAIGGGHWCRVARGWKWDGPDGTGSTFPRPGGDWTRELVAPVGAARDRPVDFVAQNFGDFWCIQTTCGPEPRAYAIRKEDGVLFELPDDRVPFVIVKPLESLTPSREQGEGS